MSIEVFNRYEKKYIMDADTAMSLMERVAEYMNPDKFNISGKTYSICNIYYDTDNDDLIARSIMKPVYKEKLRLRGYGVPSKEDKVYLEIKKKYDGIVNKRRSKLKLYEAVDMVNTGKMPPLKDYMNEQILKEIEYLLSTMKLLPKLYLAYDRYAFFEKNNDDFRLTFDMNVRSRRDRLSLDAGDDGKLLFEDGRWIMEMKAYNAVPLWFARLLSEYRLYPQSVSKYGTEYKNKMEEMKCLIQY